MERSDIGIAWRNAAPDFADTQSGYLLQARKRKRAAPAGAE
jgi:hypothetical protein